MITKHCQTIATIIAYVSAIYLVGWLAEVQAYKNLGMTISIDNLVLAKLIDPHGIRIFWGLIVAVIVLNVKLVYGLIFNFLHK